MFLLRQAFAGSLLAGSILISGCALVPGLQIDVDDSRSDTHPSYKVVTVTPDVIAEQRQQATFEPDADLVPANTIEPPTEYKIGPGDVLQIVVWDHLELTNPFGAITRDPVSAGQLIASDGTTYFPYVGVFKAAGLTIQQVRDYVTRNLTSVVNKPQVDVRVAAFRSARIQVTGEVKEPGVVTLDDTTKGLLEALDERGGLDPVASRRTAILIRDGKTHLVDIAGLLSGNSPAINPLLKAGDIVQIPDASNDEVFVLGEIAKPGPVPMSQLQLTVTETLTKSGGMDRLTASDSGVLIFRRAEESRQIATVYALDMSTPQGLLMAGDFTLQPRDVVYVKATKFAQYNLIISQLLPTIMAEYQLHVGTN